MESWVDTLGDGCGYPSTVQRITLAGKLFAEHRDALRGSTRTASLLSRLERDLEASVRMMLDFGIVEACSRCDEQAPEGSCCSRGLEEKIDPVTLIANLLLGVGTPGTATARGQLLLPRPSRLPSPPAAHALRRLSLPGTGKGTGQGAAPHRSGDFRPRNRIGVSPPGRNQAHPPRLKLPVRPVISYRFAFEIGQSCSTLVTKSIDSVAPPHPTITEQQ